MQSIFDHPNAQYLLDHFAGTGRKANHMTPGKPGYKEIVDFQEPIGIWKNQEGSIALPTRRGAIHYSRNGTHIVPLEQK